MCVATSTGDECGKLSEREILQNVEELNAAIAQEEIFSKVDVSDDPPKTIEVSLLDTLPETFSNEELLLGTVKPKDSAEFLSEMITSSRISEQQRLLDPVVSKDVQLNDKRLSEFVANNDTIIESEHTSHAHFEIKTELAGESLPADVVIPKREKVGMELSKTVHRDPSESLVELDFDVNPGKLYTALQRKDWDLVLMQLREFPEESSFWISRREIDGRLRWRLLPIHGALVFKAPEFIIQALLDAYPDGARATDDQGMLPIHLSYKAGSSEIVVRMLYSAFPDSLTVADRKGRTPVQLAETTYGTNREGFLCALESTNHNDVESSIEGTTAEQGNTTRSVPILVDDLPTTLTIATTPVSITKLDRMIFLAKSDDSTTQATRPLGTGVQVEARKMNSSTAVTSTKTTIEVHGKKHELELESLRKEIQIKEGTFQQTMKELKAELENKAETSKVLMEHVTSLESQIKSRGHMERFLATKIATLDRSLKATKQDKLESENRLNEEIHKLQSNLEEAMIEGATHTRGKDEYIKALEAQLAGAKIAALAGNSVKSKKGRPTEEETLENQVASLLSLLSAPNSESSLTTASLTMRVKGLESERNDLRKTIAKLTKKLYKVASVIDGIVSQQQDLLLENGASDDDDCDDRQLVRGSKKVEKLQVQITETQDAVEDVLPHKSDDGDDERLVDRAILHVLTSSSFAEGESCDTAPFHPKCNQKGSLTLSDEEKKADDTDAVAIF